ncbi:MAG: cupin domain-containing protein [Candidatus Eremiobacteraeota bacterium]|nr:cupin domain-containing protein [Candidatus Eremiobacteraeota bacterium]
MPFIDTRELPVVERKPGWHGRYFSSENMTFGHYSFDAGATLHEHQHEQEEVWNVLEGELEITIDGVIQRAGPGFVGIIPAETPHAVKALSGGRAIVVDHPIREGFD